MPCERLHDRAAYPGTGIGLAMCRKIIEYFGGRIWLDTAVATGARFRFTVPALAGDERDEASERSGPNERNEETDGTDN